MDTADFVFHVVRAVFTAIPFIANRPAETGLFGHCWKFIWKARLKTEENNCCEFGLSQESATDGHPITI